MEEFSADQEFYDNYMKVRNILLSQGWKEGKPSKDEKMITNLFTKDGFGIYILYGCEEEVKDEIL